MLNAHSSPNGSTAAPEQRHSRVGEPPERSPKKRKRFHGFEAGFDAHSTPPKPKRPALTVNGASSSHASKAAMAKAREALPIFPGRDAIVDAVKKNHSVVIIGEPGSGKTTQVPQYLLDAGMISSSGLIAITQPRKVAATTIAARVASERAGDVGSEVGYAIRFEDASSSKTKIKFYTDGMLLREMLNDPKLDKCDIVVVDEAHERTLRTDVLLANLRRIQKERNGSEASHNGKGKERDVERKLKIIVMSASLQAERFSKYLGGAPILYVKGRQHPVKIYYTKEHQDNYNDSALRTFFQIHDGKEPGDVLIFLPGQEAIEELSSTIKMYAKQRPADALGVVVRPLYAALPVSKQHEAFAPAPSNTRKCVLATNIAETSVTIPGIKFVIDCGVCNEKQFLARSKGPGLERLTEVEISKSSAIQRAGRAGREGPGKCFRLYTEEAYKQLVPSPLPEIKRCDLTFAMLQQKAFGQNIEEIDFMDPPEKTAVVVSQHILLTLDGIDSSGRITPVGRAMAKLPLDPPLARALLQARELGCLKEMISIVSILSASAKVFLDTSVAEEREAALEARSKFFHRSGDHLTLLNVFQAYDELKSGSGAGHDSSDDEKRFSVGKSDRKSWCRKQHINERALKEATKIREQIKRACAAAGMDVNASCGDDADPILQSLYSGLRHHVAMKQADNTYVAAGQVVKIHPSCVLCDKRPSAIIYGELIMTTQPFVRCVSSILPAWIMHALAAQKATR